MSKKFDKSIFIGRFKEETNEHLARLGKDLLSLEKNSKNQQLLEDMMREAHTLKGSAAMMGFGRIAEMAHKFEDALSQIVKGKIEPSDLHYDFLFKALDSIKPLLEGEDKDAAYSHLKDLEKKIDRAFGLSGEQITIEKPEEKEEKKETIEPVPSAATESIRVDVEKLDQLMNMAGELVIGKIRIGQRREDLGNLLSKVEELNLKLSRIREKEAPVELARQLKRDFDHIIEEFGRTADEVDFVTSQLQERVMEVRMLPLEIIFRAFPRAVRDLSKSEQKLIDFNVTGEEIELDKTVIEKMQDPLMHILRNAISHGIELPGERKAHDKPEAGKINLRAYHKGSQVIIEVEDDGRGIDANKIKEQALRKGLLNKEQAEKMPASQALYLLFTPGLSTEARISQLSGRGVGLDVVRTNVAQLKGLIDISSQAGKGAKFIIKLPLTLAISLALFVKAYGQSFAIPLDNVLETIKITPEEIKTVEKREAVSLRDEIIPLIRLGEVLGLERRTMNDERRNIPVVIVAIAEKKLAILVDALTGKLEIVVKSLGEHLKKAPNIAGATILGTGEVALILDVSSLVLGRSSLPGLVRPVSTKVVKETVQRSILVVEDSLVTRDLEKSILEAAGYKVGLARDGQEALSKLAEQKFDLVLADIAMPGIDGIEMLNRMKKDERFKDIPVVVVSSKRSDEDKKRGMEAGADAYFVKSDFDQAKLVDVIKRLIGQ